MLTWRWVDDLIVNGSFETGFSPGWYTGGQYPNLWQIYTANTNAYGMGFKLATTYMPNAPASNGQLIQDFYIPADAVSATLQWKVRILRFGPPGLLGRLRVLLYQGGAPVKLLDDAMGTEPQYAGFAWVSRSTNLIAFAGQSLQLVFQADGYLPRAALDWTANLDGLSFTCEYFSSLPEFQVYLGKNATLRTTNLVGSLPALSFTAPPLDPSSTYYWRIGAVRYGVTNYSSTRSFTTAQRVLPRVTATGLTPTGVRLSFPTRADRFYTIEQRDTLDNGSTWFDVLSVGFGSGAVMEVEVPFPLNDTAYWRLRITP